MRRRDREIVDRTEIDAIIHRAEVCRLGLIVDGEPYVVPVSFGYDGEALFIHTAAAGRKLEALAAGGRVCFELECDVALVTDDKDPCRWSYTYASVIGWGRPCEITGESERRAALDRIMEHYSGRSWPREDFRPAGVRVWRIDVETVTGKRSRPGKSESD